MSEKNQDLQSIEDVKGNPILKSKIEHLPLTARTRNYLRAENIEYVFEILQYDYSDIAKFYNMGKKSVQEIKDFLEGHKIYLPLDGGDFLGLPEKPALGDHDSNRRYLAQCEAIFFPEKNSFSHQQEPKKLLDVKVPLYSDFVAAVLHSTPTESLVDTLRARLKEMPEEERNQTLKSLEGDF